MSTRPHHIHHMLSALCLALGALLLAPGLAAPVSADRVEEPDPDLTALFDELRAEIASTEELPDGPRTSLLAKVDAAEVALLLPAVQSVREAARNQQAAVRVLTALQHQNQVLSNRFGYEGGEIDRRAQAITRYVIDQAWPS